MVLLSNTKSSPIFVWSVSPQYSTLQDGVSLSTISDICNYPYLLVLGFLPLSPCYLLRTPGYGNQPHWENTSVFFPGKWILLETLSFFINRTCWLIRFISVFLFCKDHGLLILLCETADYQLLSSVITVLIIYATTGLDQCLYQLLYNHKINVPFCPVALDW